MRVQQLSRVRACLTDDQHVNAVQKRIVSTICGGDCIGLPRCANVLPHRRSLLSGDDKTSFWLDVCPRKLHSGWLQSITA